MQNISYKQNISEFEQFLSSYSSILGLYKIPYKYIKALLQEIRDRDTFTDIFMYSYPMGLYKFIKEKTVLEETSTTIDLQVFLRTQISSVKSNKLLVLDIPTELYQNIDIQYLIIVLGRVIRENKSKTKLLLLYSTNLPPSLVDVVSDIELTIPQPNTATEKLDVYVKRLLVQSSVLIPTTSPHFNKIVRAFQGLPAYTIEEIISSIAHTRNTQDNQYDYAELLKDIYKIKQQNLQQTAGLEVISIKKTGDALGGFNYLRRYVEQKAEILQNKDRANELGVDTPKGFLLVGLPGCGKSLAAEVTAHVMNLPLLRLDMGALMGKYLGESEQNLTNVLNITIASAPCILWIDEIEKAFGGLTGDSSGTGQRMLGKLLTWTQEQKQGVYIIATANSTETLPIELMRRGRFDELFSVDIPNKEELRQILKIHVENRNVKWDSIDSKDKLIELLDNFTGADIEAVVKEAKALSWGVRKELDFSHFKTVLDRFTPLTNQFKDKIGQIRTTLQKAGFRPVSVPDESLDRYLPPTKKNIPQLSTQLQEILNSTERMVFNIDQKTTCYLLVTGNSIKDRKIGLISDPELNYHDFEFTTTIVNTKLNLEIKNKHSRPRLQLESIFSEKNQLYLEYSTQDNKKYQSKLHLRQQRYVETFSKDLYTWLWKTDNSPIRNNSDVSLRRIQTTEPKWELLLNNTEYNNEPIAIYSASIRHNRIFLCTEKISYTTEKAYKTEKLHSIWKQHLGFIVSSKSKAIDISVLTEEQITIELQKDGIEYTSWYKEITEKLNKIQTNSSLNIELVYIPPTNVINPMLVGKYPVTQELYERVMGINPSGFKGATRPVESVSWYNAVEFCNKLSELEGKEKAYTINGGDVSCNFTTKGYRLLTEAEWEYCARGGQRFKYSGSDDVDEVAWYNENSGGETHPVSLKKYNGFGLYDMSGNVWEWCWDWKDDYSSANQEDPCGPTNGFNRVRRGGSWNYFVRHMRVSYRRDDAPTVTRRNLGFRLGLTP